MLTHVSLKISFKVGLRMRWLEERSAGWEEGWTPGALQVRHSPGHHVGMSGQRTEGRPSQTDRQTAEDWFLTAAAAQETK